MTGWEVVADIIGSLAWPAVVVFAAVRFREPIGELIGRIKSAKAGGWEFDFESVADDAKDEAEKVLSDVQKGAGVDASPVIPDPEPVDISSTEDPTFAVISSWERLVGEVRDLANAVTRWEGSSPFPANSSPQRLVQMLYERGEFKESYVRSFTSLRELRNAVAHGRRVTRSEAESFVAAVNELTRATEVIIDFKYDGG